MNKLTIAATLSILALSFSGAALADGGKRYNKDAQKRVISKTSYTKSVKPTAIKYARNTKPVKRVIVKKTPTKKVVIIKRVVKKPANTKIVSTKRFNKFKRLAKKQVYAVRPGDTLIQISFKTGVSILDIARLNRISYANLNRLHVGQVLRLS